jgi:hypothetical protein
MQVARLHIAAALALAGCTGTIDEDLPEGITPEQEAARKIWIQKAHPVLDQNCASCHGGSRPEVAWLEGAPDPYAQKTDLLTYEKMIVSLSAPQTSMLVKKGAHEGPALTATQASGIIEWITAEREASPDASGFPVMTAPIAAMPCTAGAPGSPTCPYNEIPLDAAGAAGAKVQFTAMDISGSLYLSNLVVIPGPTGVYVEHPVVVSVPVMAEPKPDPLDRYFNITLNLPPDAPLAMQRIGTGAGSFVGFAPADPVAFYFMAVGPMK